MMGTLLNAGAIFLGAVFGLTTKVEVSVQQQIKVLLGVATVWFGLKLVWDGLRWDASSTGTGSHFFRQLVVVLLAMVIGHAIGRLCRIQKWMNRLGQKAKV